MVQAVDLTPVPAHASTGGQIPLKGHFPYRVTADTRLDKRPRSSSSRNPGGTYFRAWASSITKKGGRLLQLRLEAIELMPTGRTLIPTLRFSKRRYSSTVPVHPLSPIYIVVPLTLWFSLCYLSGHTRVSTTSRLAPDPAFPPTCGFRDFAAFKHVLNLYNFAFATDRLETSTKILLCSMLELPRRTA